MKNSTPRSTSVERDSHQESGIDYTPKKYSLKEQLLYGAKLTIIVGIIFGLIWLSEM